MSLAKFARRLMTRPVRTPAAAPIRSRTVGRSIEQLEDRVNPVITLSFAAGVATFTSDVAGDTLQVQATANPGDILYNSGGIGLASLTGVTQLIYNGQAGNDLLILASPPGTHFAPTNGIQFNAGGDAKDELDLIGGAGTWKGTYAPTSPTAGGLTFTNTPGVAVQNIAFTGLPTIRNSLTSASMSITTPAANDTINVFAGPNLLDIGAVAQGPVIIDGGDRDEHGFFGSGENQDGWLFIEQSVDFIRDNAFNAAPANSVLAIGITGSSAAAALNSVASVLGLTVTTVTGAAIDTVNFNNYRMIYVPSDSGNTGGGIVQADLNRLNARATVGTPTVPSIRDYINSGGGIFALTEAVSTNPYGWLQIPTAFTIQSFGGGGISQPLRKTPAAISAGFTISDAELSNGVPYHNVFTGPAGFNNLLPFVLDRGPNNVIDGMAPAGDDRVLTLGLGAIMNPGLGGAGPSSAITFGIHPTTIATQQYPQMFLSATPVVNVNGAGGADTVNIGVGSPVLTAVNVTDSGGTAGDVVQIFGTAGNDVFDVNTAAASTVRWGLGGPVKETITYANVEQLTVHGPVAIDPVPTAPTITDGSDTFTVTPEPNTAITIRGGLPVHPTAPGDRLNLVAFGMLNPSLATPSLPHGSITSTNRATVDWTSIETFPVPLGLGGSFDFETDPSGALTQAEWISVVPSDLASSGRYSKYNTGWVTAPLGFDRDGTNGYLPPPGPYSLLLRDGAWGFQGAAEARDFRVAVAPNEPIQITAILGDTATINDSVDVLWSDNGGATFTLLNPAADTFQNSLDKGFKFVSYSSGTITPATNSLLVRIRDNFGNYHWTIDALDVRPVDLRADLQLARQDLTLPSTKVVADGLTVDYYTGFKAAAGAVMTIEPQYGVVVDASFGTPGLQPDAFPQLAGFQIVADANGEFSFGVRRPTGEGPDAIVVREAFGWAKNTITQSYSLPDVRRIDFGTAGSPVAVGVPVAEPYIGVGEAQYTSRVANALGWVGTVTAADRAMGSALQRDLVYGTAGANRDFRINMPGPGTYFVTVVLGDPGFARDGMFVSLINTGTFAVTSTPVSGVSTPAGQSVSRTFTAVADINGEIRLRFGDASDDLFWTVQALEVRPTQGVITIAGATSVPADGMTTTTYTLSGATAGAIVTVTNTHGTVMTADADPSFVGFQVIANGAGTATFDIVSPQATSNLTATLTADETTGARAAAPYTVTYTGTTGGGGGTTAYRFDFNGGGVVNTTGFVSVRGSDTFSTVAGYGWASGVNEFERTAASVSGKGVIASQVPLYQDGAWSFGSGVFQVAVTKNETNLAARIYVGDSYTNWPYIVLNVEGGTPLPLNTSATPFGAYTLTGGDANGDGKWDITISSGYVWVVNGIDVASGGATNLPALPQSATAGPIKAEGDILGGGELAPVVAAAIDRLTAAGNLTAAQVAQLRDVRFVVGDLPAGHLGEHVGGLVRLDADAGGRGWFVDPTPNDDAEFTPVSATEAVGGRGVDLLTVVMHELSHELGATDVDAGFDPDSLMTESLGAGVRRLPNGGSWALSVGVQLPVAEEVEVVGPVAGSTVRPVALVKEESVWADAPAVSGAEWSWSDAPALQPDWFADDLLGGVRVA